MKKQTPPSSQGTRPKNAAQNNPPQAKVPAANDKTQPPAKEAPSKDAPSGSYANNFVAAVRKNSIIRRLSQRRRTNLEDQNKPNWKSLSTGLEMLFSEEQVKKMWTFDKPKIIISELLNEILRRLDAQKNFESMELNIISEFHLYNLIFAKQKLFLDDNKAAIFLNLMWTLLINDNQDYKLVHQNYTRVSMQSIDDHKKRNSIQQINVQTTSQPIQNRNSLLNSVGLQQKVSSLTNISENLKSVNRDLENFKKWIVKHSTHDPPLSLRIFDAQQIQMIVEFAQNSYFSNFSLYNYCLNNKKKNEEIEIQLYIDRPLIIPPLSDALYMGKPKIEIPEDEDDIIENKNKNKYKKAASNIGSRQKLQSFTQIDKDGQREDKEAGQEQQLDDQEFDEEGEYENEGEEDQNENVLTKKIDPEEEEVRNIVDAKLKTVEEQFQQTLQKRKEDLDRQYEDIVNPKKKK